MAKTAWHVVPSPNGWSVLRSGNIRATGVYATHEQALAVATELAQRQQSELYIHGADGRIREVNNFAAGTVLPSA